MLIHTATIIFLLLPIVCGQLIWEKISAGNETPAPSVRRDVGLGYDKSRDQIIMFGGRTNARQSERVLKDTWIFKKSSGEWREVAIDAGPSARFSMVAGVSGDYFYVSTGEGPNSFFLNDIWRFNLMDEKWEELPVLMKPDYYSDSEWSALKRKSMRPEPRYGSAGGIYPGTSRFFISHGFSDRRYSNTFSYDVNATGWYKEYSGGNPYNPSYPHARCLHAGTMVGPDKLVIYGGCLSGGKSGGPCPSRDSWSFDVTRREWKRIDSCSSARTYPSMAMLPPQKGFRRAVLYGGKETGKQVIMTVKAPKEQVGIYNPDSESWMLRQTTGDIPEKRYSAAMVTGKDGIYMFGGKSVESGDLLNDLYLLGGDSEKADQADKDADCGPTFFNMIMLHGILMTAGWGFCLQIGAFIARYFRNSPKWFHLHRFFQVTGLLLAIGGLVCGFMSVEFAHLEFTHGIIGIVVMVIGIQQPFGALVRPPHAEKGEAKTLRRLIWEKYHHFAGRAALILALVNISLGVFFALASFAVYVTWFVYLGIIVLCYIVAEFCKHWKDKYGIEPVVMDSSRNSGHISDEKSPHHLNNFDLEDRK